MGISLGAVVEHLDPRRDTTGLNALVDGLEISWAELSAEAAGDGLDGLFLPSQYYKLQLTSHFLSYVVNKPVSRGGLVGAVAGVGTALLFGQDTVLYGLLGAAIGYAADAIPYWLRVIFYLNGRSAQHDS